MFIISIFAGGVQDGDTAVMQTVSLLCALRSNRVCRSGGGTNLLFRCEIFEQFRLAPSGYANVSKYDRSRYKNSLWLKAGRSEVSLTAGGVAEKKQKTTTIL